MKCPNCGTQSDGRFCPSCGKPLGGPGSCASCGAKLSAGASFCTRCGEPVGGRSSKLSLPWIITGAAVVVLLAVVLMPYARGRRVSATPGGASPFAGAPSPAPLDPLSGTPREQADRLFNRIMQENAQGNVDQAKFFAPMAIQAYDAAGPLDADGLYHLSLIQAVAGDFPAARATAERILAATPTHLLGLAALAEAALGESDTTAARDAYRRFLDNLAAEQAKGLREYTDHSAILPAYEQDARAAVGS